MTLKLSATHIVGGELNYQYLGNYNYRIRLVVYRDCFNGQAPFDDPASIGVFNSSNALTRQVFISPTTQGNVPNYINSPCLVPPTNVCYEYAEYDTVVYLPPIPGGYQLAYQRCCRNSSINNVANLPVVGATYYATIPDTSIVAVNSNPQFTHLPPTFICQGASFHFDHSAIDPDGDALVYELYTPLDGADNIIPMPQPPNPPPYSHIQFQSPYTLSNVLGGAPMTIDPATGMLTATPGFLGQFVYGVSVKEYRNGVLIGRTIRDYQVNVVPCPNITVASIFSPTIVCGSLEANFVNNSYNAITYNWDFGDPSNPNDTSTAINPAYVYPDTGIYHATLIAHSPINPLCTDTATGEIRVFPSFYSNFTISNQHCSNQFNFYDASFGHHAPANYWSWNFGDGTFASVQNGNHSYPTPGAYEVRFISSADSGCTDTSTTLIHVLAIPVAMFAAVVDTCHLKVTCTNQSLFASTYTWDFDDGFSATSGNVSHAYSSSGFFDILLMSVSDSGCSDTTHLRILLPPLPVASYTAQHALCDSSVSFNDQSSNSILNEWDFGDGTFSSGINITHVYSSPGTYSANLVIHSASCSDTLAHLIIINPVPEALFHRPFICGLSGDFLNQSRQADYYKWDFGDHTFSQDQDPLHTYNSPGYYNVELTALTNIGCADSVMERVHVYPAVTSLFTPNVIPCDPQVKFRNNSINGQFYKWDFGDSATTVTAAANVSHRYRHAGDYIASLISNPGVCADTSYQNFRVSVSPVSSFTHPDECSLTLHFENTSNDLRYSHWNFGDDVISSLVNPVHTFPLDSTYLVTLISENDDGCTDTSSSSVKARLPAIAGFSDFTDTCEQTVKLFNHSQRAADYLWDFGDGIYSDNLSTMHQYYSSGFYDVMLIAEPLSACADTMSKTVFAYGTNESFLFIPQAFTPNGDGKNDEFVISGYNKCLFYHLEIFNRWGELVYESNDISKHWNGFYKGKLIEEGVYIYLLSGGGNELKGSVTVLK